MLNSTAYRLADAALDGTLYARLKAWRDAGVSCQAISNLLKAEIGAEINQETLRRWCRQLHIDTPQEKAGGAPPTSPRRAAS